MKYQGYDNGSHNYKVNSNAIGSAYGCNVMIITIIMVSLMINETGKYNSNQSPIIIIVMVVKI